MIAQDPMGAALMRYWETKNPLLELAVSTNITEPDPYPLSYFFRDWDNMPPIEQRALQMAEGNILDVGAGTGAHTLVLQTMGKQSLPIDISTLSVELMHQRGLHQAQCQDFYTMPETQKFDTILLLMNGIGLVKQIDNLPAFFQKVDRLLAPGGQLITDSSDIIYMFQEEDGSILIDLNANYYGEVFFQVAFQGIEGKPYPWLFIDYDKLQMAAGRAGFRAECVMQGEHYDYLARISKIT